MTQFSRIILPALFLLFNLQLHAQQWVDTLYSYQLTTDVEYGTAIDFAGNQRLLTMDFCEPLNDSPPECGRPLLIAIHGGAFLAGSKNDGTLQRLMKDFAKRGYFTASVNYRLGMFQTEKNVHCNFTQLFNSPWDCSNMADTAEWYRALYRAQQDVKGAIRFLVDRSEALQIDPQQVFLVGESAGGFTALATAFLDTPGEKFLEAYALPDALPPNNIYENTCVQAFDLDTSIASMNLARPDLGPIEGTLNLNAAAYRVKGVGNFYGGIFKNLFAEHNYAEQPALYMFHQPADLIVPYNYGTVLGGYAYCATLLGCQYIINRPYTYGSLGVKKILDSLSQNGMPVPDYEFQNTTNNAGCAEQVLNPSLAGHALDNYWLRSVQLANLFASRIDDDALCLDAATDQKFKNAKFWLYPNPSKGKLYLNSNKDVVINEAVLVNLTGQVIWRKAQLQNFPAPLELPEKLAAGIYYLKFKSNGRMNLLKLVVVK